MRRRIRRRKNKQNKIVIVTSICLLLCLCVGYAAFETNISITAKGNVVQNTRIIQSWDDNSQTDFHSDFYKESIVSVTFLNNNNVPESATEEWNVSEDQENGSVMAWVVPNNNDNTKYDLYIGAPSGVIANEDSSYIFSEFTGITSIEFNNNFDTSKVTNMSYMFYYCSSLTELDLSSFDTSKVTDMSYMFVYCISLADLNLSNFNTSNVIDMSGMFAGCITLTELDVSNFDTSSVTNMSDMFNSVYIYKLDLSKFDTSKVTNMTGMFYDAQGPMEIIFPENFGSAATTMELMFAKSSRSSGFTKLDVSNFNTSKVTDMSYMFYNNYALTEIVGLENFDTSNVTDMEGMFWDCHLLTELNLCSFNTAKVTNISYMFWMTYQLQQVLVGSNWTLSTSDLFTFSGVSEVTTGQC